MRGKKMFGKGRFGGGMIFKTEVVNGICPACTSDAVFVSICSSIYRCTNCGTDLEQKVNGIIKYIPASVHGSKIPVLKTIEDGPQKA